jgi:predicted ester cyclase
MIAASVGLFACSSSGDATKADAPPVEETAPAAKSPAQMVIDGHAAWSAGELDKASEMFADDVAWTVVASKNPGATGLDAVKELWAGQRAAFPDAQAKPAFIYQGDGVTVVEGVFTGTNNGPMMSPKGEMPATNKPVGGGYAHIYWWNADGKISRVDAYVNEAAQLQQLGVMPVPEGKTVPTLTALPSETKVFDEPGKLSTDLIQAMTKAWLDWDEATLKSMSADEVKFIDHGERATFNSFEAVAAKEAEMRKVFTELGWTADQTWSIGPALIATGTFSGKHTGDMGPMKATNKSFSTKSIGIYWFNDAGKMVEMHGYHNPMDVMGQLMPEQPAQASAQ